MSRREKLPDFFRTLEELGDAESLSRLDTSSWDWLKLGSFCRFLRRNKSLVPLRRNPTADKGQINNTKQHLHVLQTCRTVHFINPSYQSAIIWKILRKNRYKASCPQLVKFWGNADSRAISSASCFFSAYLAQLKLEAGVTHRQDRNWWIVFRKVNRLHLHDNFLPSSKALYRWCFCRPTHKHIHTNWQWGLPCKVPMGGIQERHRHQITNKGLCSLTFVVFEASRFQGSRGTRLWLHVVHRWTLGHVWRCCLIRVRVGGGPAVVVGATRRVLPLQGSVHGCSIAHRQRTVILSDGDLKNKQRKYQQMTLRPIWCVCIIIDLIFRLVLHHLIMENLKTHKKVMVHSDLTRRSVLVH